MAREEAAREDLLAEATALVDRLELRVPGEPELVVVGFRRDGCGSLYCGESPAFHFNTAGQLRRAFLEGRLIKAEQGRLVSLVRERSAAEVALVRHALDEHETAQLLAEFARRATLLVQAIERGQAEVVRQATADPQLLARVRQWLTTLLPGPAIASSPHAR